MYDYFFFREKSRIYTFINFLNFCPTIWTFNLLKNNYCSTAFPSAWLPCIIWAQTAIISPVNNQSMEKDLGDVMQWDWNRSGFHMNFGQWLYYAIRYVLLFLLCLPMSLLVSVFQFLCKILNSIWNSLPKWVIFQQTITQKFTIKVISCSISSLVLLVLVFCVSSMLSMLPVFWSCEWNSNKYEIMSFDSLYSIIQDLKVHGLSMTWVLLLTFFYASFNSKTLEIFHGNYIALCTSIYFNVYYFLGNLDVFIPLINIHKIIGAKHLKYIVHLCCHYQCFEHHEHFCLSFCLVLHTHAK